MTFIKDFISNVLNWVKTSATSLPVLIAIILSVAFVSMLLITVFTLISMKRSEMKARRVIDIPPSAMKTDDKKEEPEDDKDTSYPWPIGERLNKYLIEKGYIRVNNIVRSFFKAMEYLSQSLGVGYKYKLPWYVILGTEGSGKSSLLGGFTHDEIKEDESDPTCTWWFLKGGVILDIKGNAFVPKEGFNADEKSWNVILNMLSRYRTQRPLNGLILTIPATELYGKSKLPYEVLKKRALYMARKLNFAQSYMGIKLPVYVVITKTDVVPGFQSFCSEIPIRNRNNMLGWSSPYATDVLYSSKMLEEGFADFEDELNEIRMEIFSEGLTSTTRDGIFVFPSELLTIKKSLAVYIDTIFKSTTAENNFFFRGFYFTGDSKMVPLLSFESSNVSDEPMAIMGTPDADVNEAGTTTISFDNEKFAPKKIFFVEDLIMKKVFMEEGIAAPMIPKIKNANKSIFISKVSAAAFVLIGSYGLFNANDQLRHHRNNLYPALFKISSLIKSASDLTYKDLNHNGNEILAECTSHLLSMMQELHNARLSSIFVPASWFSSINKDLTETLRISYQRVVVRTRYMNLILKARELLGAVPVTSSSSVAALLNPYGSVEYQQVKSYVFGLIELEKHIKKFDSLRTSGDPKDLNDLIDYTFKGTLPKEFLDNYQQFRSILMNTPFPAINLSPYKQVAYDKLLSLFQNYIDIIFTNKSRSSLMFYLNKFIDNLSRQNLKGVPDCSELRKFANDLTKVCQELGKEGETWLDKESFESNEEFDSFLDGVEDLFGKDIAQRLLDAVAVNFGYLKARLQEFNKALKNDILRYKQKRVSKSPKEEPVSSGIFLMERCLSSFISEPFMEVPEDFKLITDIPAGKMIFWDDELVQYAYEVGQAYEQFAAVGIKEFPRAMQEGILLLAKSNLSAVIASTIAKSQSLVDAPEGLTSLITSEEILQKQVAELKTVAPKLLNLLRVLRDDKFAFVFGDLRSIINKVGSSLLNHIDRLLENQKPYYPGNLRFNFWNGESGAGLKAFSSSDLEELILYLKLQRSMIRRLGLDFAATIVDFLNDEVIYDKNYSNHAQLVKWTRIVEGLRSKEKKDPTSSLTVLEKFLKSTLNSYNLDNITSKINPKDIAGESSDYFLNLIKEIKRGILSRAEILIRKRSVERYEALQSYYSKYLEGKYPFSNYDKSQRVSMDADLDAVRNFFKMYDEFGGTPEKILDQVYQLGGDATIPFDFLKKIHTLRVFLGDFIKSKNENMKIRLEFKFDVNRREESNTDYLVDRIFRPNNDSVIEEINKDKTGIWYFGEPMEFDLRWAEGDDQADKPVYDQNDPDLLIDSTTAKVQCVGNWAALRFIQKYKADIVNVDNLGKDETLLYFRVPLHTGKIAKIYAGVTASLPKKPGDPSVVTIKVPETPDVMPDMPESVKMVQNEAVLVERYTSGNEPKEKEDDEEESATVDLDLDDDEVDIDEDGDPETVVVAELPEDIKPAPIQTKKTNSQKKKASQTTVPTPKPKTTEEQVEEILEAPILEEEPIMEISESPIE